MNPANINQAMVNRSNAQYEIKTINKRISDIASRMNGIDIVFRPNELISGTVISDLIKGATSAEWYNPDTFSNAVVYEAPAPSSYINNLRPASMWKAHVVKDNTQADAYSPLESFIRQTDGTFRFSPMQSQTISAELKNYGGNLQNAVMPLISATTGDALKITNTIISNIASSNILNIDNLYYIQNTDLISNTFNGAHAESFTLHFE